jgi:hypothetical protein
MKLGVAQAELIEVVRELQEELRDVFARIDDNGEWTPVTSDALQTLDQGFALLVGSIATFDESQVESAPDETEPGPSGAN